MHFCNKKLQRFSAKSSLTAYYSPLSAFADKTTHLFHTRRQRHMCTVCDQTPRVVGGIRAPATPTAKSRVRVPALALASAPVAQAKDTASQTSRVPTIRASQPYTCPMRRTTRQAPHKIRSGSKEHRRTSGSPTAPCPLPPSATRLNIATSTAQAWEGPRPDS